MNVWLQLWHTIRDLFSKPYKAMLALLFLSAASLVAPAPHYDSWLQSHRVLEWGCFLFATFYLALVAIEWIGSRIFLWRYLQHLAEDERRVFHSFIVWDEKTYGFIANAVTASALAGIGLLDACDPKYKSPDDKRSLFHFTIKTWVFRYLKKHPHLISLRNPKELGKNAIYGA